MSRTNKTAPFSVRLTSDPHRLTKEFHDHRNGVCELGPGAPAPSAFTDINPGDCYRGPLASYWYCRGSGCPCPLCHSVAEPLAARRRRYADRVLTQRIAKSLYLLPRALTLEHRILCHGLVARSRPRVATNDAGRAERDCATPPAWRVIPPGSAVRLVAGHPPSGPRRIPPV